MAIVYSCDVQERLREKGFTSYRMRKEQLISQGALQKIREGKLVSWHEMDQICTMLECQPGDLVRHQAEVQSDEG